MKRPPVTRQTLASKVAEGNLTHWLHYLKDDLDRFVLEYRDLMTTSQKLTVVDISDSVLRALQDDAAKDIVFGRTGPGDRVLGHLRSIVDILNADTVVDALNLIDPAHEPTPDPDPITEEASAA